MFGGWNKLGREGFLFLLNDKLNLLLIFKHEQILLVSTPTENLLTVKVLTGIPNTFYRQQLLISAHGIKHSRKHDVNLGMAVKHPGKRNIKKSITF